MSVQPAGPASHIQQFFHQARRTPWAGPLGAVSCVLGSITLIICTCRFMQMLAAVFRWGARGLWREEAGVWPITAASLALILAGVLLAAGVQLIRRSPTAGVLHLVYALGAMLLQGLNISVAWSALAAGGLSSAFSSGRATGWVVSLLYPLFCLAWFSAKTIRDRINAWGEPEPHVGGAPAAEPVPGPAAPPAPSPPVSPATPQTVPPMAPAPRAPETAAAQATPATKSETAIRKQLEVEARFKRGTGWFYAIGALSLINSILAISKSTFMFVIGLGITQVIGAIGGAFEEKGIAGARCTALVVEIAAALTVIVFGALARREQRWAIILGMALYALDAVPLALFQDWFAFGFHGLALWGLYSGLKALGEMQRSRQAEAAPSGPAPPAAPPGADAS